MITRIVCWIGLSAIVALMSSVTIPDYDTLLANRIPWNAERKLTWDDFIGQPAGHVSHVAITSYEIGLDYTISDHEFDFTVDCEFIKHASWVKAKGKTAYILNHEQKHFDLGEVYARKLRKRLLEAPITIDNHNARVNAIYDEVWRACLAEQRAYDRETDHSRDKERQAKWDEKISEMLKKTQLLSPTRFVKQQ